MTKRQARRYVLSVLAQTLRADFDSGAGWLEEHPNGGKPLSEADQTRVREAAEAVMAELQAKSGG